LIVDRKQRFKLSLHVWKFTSWCEGKCVRVINLILYSLSSLSHSLSHNWMSPSCDWYSFMLDSMNSCMHSSVKKGIWNLENVFVKSMWDKLWMVAVWWWLCFVEEYSMTHHICVYSNQWELSWARSWSMIVYY